MITSIAHLLLLAIFTTITHGLYCPPVDPPCSCASSTFEPINIRCSGASSLNQITTSLSSLKASLKIDSLIINATSINFLPPRAFQGLNIGRLVIRKANMSELDAAAFDDDSGLLYESIVELDLTDNNFTKIPFNGVSKLRNLRKVILAKNQISVLNRDSFVGYSSKEKLLSLDLSANKLNFIDESGLVELKSLEEINLQNNLFTELPIAALRAKKSSLKNLNIALNKITRLDPFVFDFPQLESLSLEYNELSDLSPEAMHGLPSLLYLYLTGNKLTRWESELFRNLANLRNLGIGGTAITHLPWNAFAHLPRLMRLEMSDGNVQTLDDRAFKGARFLQAIILNNNKLTEIKSDTFQGLTDLYSLDLSRNNIQKIADSAFSKLIGLKHLDLSLNELRNLEQNVFDKTFTTSSDTKMLYLCRNPWQCDEKMDTFRRWLRENMEITIDKPDCTAVCKDPDWLTNWPVRFPNPPPPSVLQTETSRYQHLRPITPEYGIQSTTTAGTTTVAPFWPPYAFAMTTPNGQFNSAHIPTDQQTSTTQFTPYPNPFPDPNATPTPTPTFAYLQRNPAMSESKDPPAMLSTRTDMRSLPTFAQILFGRIPGPVRSVFSFGAFARPSRKENEYRYNNAYA